MGSDASQGIRQQFHWTPRRRRLVGRLVVGALTGRLVGGFSERIVGAFVACRVVGVFVGRRRPYATPASGNGRYK